MIKIIIVKWICYRFKILLYLKKKKKKTFWASPQLITINLDI